MTESNGILISIQTGRIQTYDNGLTDDDSKKTWTSAIAKSPVQGRVWLGRENLEGDKQANLQYHGGPDKAVLTYPAEHYEAWNREMPGVGWAYGGFGENFTVSGYTEKTVCIGDIFQIGNVIVQASEPRQPCHKLAWHWQIEDLPKIVLENGRTGWYMRVLQEGYVEAGMPFVRIEHPYPQWDIGLVTHILYHIGDDFDRAERLYECEFLGGKLRKFIREAIDTHRPQNEVSQKQFRS